MPAVMHSSNPSGGRPPSSRSPAAGNTTNNKASIAETTRLTSLRRSTPDSEAIMSSDDEHDMNRSLPSLLAKQRSAAPAEGASWLNEIQSGPPRRPSATTTTSNLSQPATPLDQSNENGGWLFQNPLGRVSSNPVAQSWNTASPWTSAQSRGVDEKHVPNRDGQPTFSIPVQPTPKTFRSQSYSVGQTDHDLTANLSSNLPSLERQRTTPSNQLPHRPSRPSLLSEVSEGSHSDWSHNRYDREYYNGRSATSPISPDGRPSNLVESSLNPLLRHATKSRAKHGQSASTSDPRTLSALHSAYHHIPGASAAEQVIDEEPEPYNLGALTRRFSELPGLGGTSELARRNQWQSSLGFGALTDIPQSRRHSMAEIPTRRNSLAGATADRDYDLPAEGNAESFNFADPQQASGSSDSHQRDQQARSYAQSYFSGVGPALRSRMESATSPVASMGVHGAPYQQSSSQGIFSRPGQDTLLYLVSFKCARAEVYYVADNTGLEVKEGDLVIVEADRGHDLGTVLNAKISWSQAKELKTKANEDHYRWLMMFSRHNQASEGVAAGGTGGMMAGSAAERLPQNVSTAVQNVFTPGMVDPAHRDQELKPKMIKRLAQPHEVATLRDKEGNEAKAKRICQQKVNETKLDMEILDAEFQTDWKKLTFFYYANTYVNFNALVTDLFKIYKTRIWMSAVNPASLNSAPVPPPRILGPGAVGTRDGVGGARPSSRQYGGNMSYVGDAYGTAGMYQGYGHTEDYDFEPRQPRGRHSHSLTPSQQTYNGLAFNADSPKINQFASGQSYGWGGYQQSPNQPYDGAPGNGFSANAITFGASGLGIPQSRQAPDPRSGHFSPIAAERASVSPISPPTAEVLSRRHF